MRASGTGPIKAVARGETACRPHFVHDAVTEANAGFPVGYATPCEGTGYEIGSHVAHQGLAQSREREEILRLGADPRRADGSASKSASSCRCPPTGRTPAAERARPDEDQARQLRFREVRPAAERKRLLDRWDREIGACRDSPATRSLPAGASAPAGSSHMRSVMRRFDPAVVWWHCRGVGAGVVPWHMQQDGLTPAVARRVSGR